VIGVELAVTQARVIVEELAVAGRADRTKTDPDLGVLAGRLLFAAQGEMFRVLAEQVFEDRYPRHGSVLAYIDQHIDQHGVRATELARLSGQHKQVVGTVIDELQRLGYVERWPDPADRRAKLICPTPRGLDQIRAAGEIMASIHVRHAQRLGPSTFEQFKTILLDVTDEQRTAARGLVVPAGESRPRGPLAEPRGCDAPPDSTSSD
jgi:DNA-binding MarR family transcriptional regulator